MPIYDFECDTCGRAYTECTMSIHEDVPTPDCCGARMARLYGGRKGRYAAGYSKPLLSNALGVNPKQLAEVRARYPEREYTDTGELVLRSHSERNRILREEGMHDNDGYSGGRSR